MEQPILLSIMDKETEKKIQKVVISILKEHRALKVRFGDDVVQQQGEIDLFPEICNTKQINQMKYRQVEKALKYSLDEDERNIIEMKYLSDQKLRDDYIYHELLIKKDSYYEKKKNALRLIATALGVI
ncbi:MULTISPECIES: ArpU family phage packaging/lysis transcriptional regulator [Bacillus]|uniref:ArpU family transcriptional regulator n=1 Tax=Bacillus cereus TaxID=1396 RepID=A0AAE9P8H5_BACCE|nr:MULTISPECIES: ArpU family phage packaging/lysis transcriptional regulator [Bacillus]MDA1536690.1 ArpU family transcriptional regulator [Bacillus cereus group sp. TH254-2LC]MDA1547249.1 ArpU family transcriptional regulator [Bacillus cereus group sp. TH253LC]MDA1582048.1 ArpU family transcriptional regulator [Bacillus cereus group sp. TH228LC]MDA1631036.1 ArpU family transcriptional regulator [Bacillus cereus group sp. TH172LC]MDA1647437.1 ArpU family transcriptional regulator [Bacillus cere